MSIRDETRAEWLSEDGLLRVEDWARQGLTDEQIAEKMGICRTTLYEWGKRHKALRAALKRGKAPVDAEVENALLKAATGYTVTVRKAVRIGDEIRFYDEEVYYPPQVAAAIFWLKNRRPDRWRDKPFPDPIQGESMVDRITVDIFRQMNDVNT